MLRRTLIGLSILALVVVVALAAAGISGLAPTLAWVGVQAAIVVIAILAEKGRYRPTPTTEQGWVRTEERFCDPSSQEWMVVEFNPRTGERRYVPLVPPNESIPPIG